jgi:hypothetical protein
MILLVVLLEKIPFIVTELPLDFLDDLLQRYPRALTWVSLEVLDEIFVAAELEYVTKD